MNLNDDNGYSPLKNANDKALEEDEIATEPEWAANLHKLYDSIVEEPIPDCFMDLLSRLDASRDAEAQAERR